MASVTNIRYALKSLNQTNHTIVYKPRLVYKSSLNKSDDKNNRTMGIPQNHGIAHKPDRGGDGKDFEEYKGSQNSVIQTIISDQS